MTLAYKTPAEKDTLLARWTYHGDVESIRGVNTEDGAKVLLSDLCSPDAFVCKVCVHALKIVAFKVHANSTNRGILRADWNQAKGRRACRQFKTPEIRGVLLGVMLKTQRFSEVLECCVQV